MGLTKGQQEAKKAIEAFLADPDPDNFEYTLVGYAGTGKTFLLNYLLEKFQHRRTIACTIAHAAKNILRANMSSHVECYTLAQALGMKQRFVKGKEIFVLDKAKEGKVKPINMAEIVIIDEGSMIDNRMMDYIRKGIDRGANVKIIYSGDAAQLPPVNEDPTKKIQDISPTFKIKNISVLTEIVRYGDLIGAVGKYYRDLIEYLERGGNEQAVVNAIHAFKPSWNNGKELIHFTSDSEWFLQNAIVDFQNNLLETRVIAYRNATIDVNNANIRPYFYDDVDKYAVGELLVLNRPFKSNKAHLYNGTVVKVLERWEEMHEFEVNLPDELTESGREIPITLKVWKLMAAPIDPVTKELLEPKELIAIHQDSEDDYEDIQNRLIDKAKNVNANLWKHLSNLRLENIFASRYYVTSCYKAQGQSIQNTYVMMSDILDVDQLSLLTMLRSLYVAVTRSKQKCIVLV